MMHMRHSRDMLSGIKALYKLIWRAEAKFSSAFVSSLKDGEKNIIFLDVVKFGVKSISVIQILHHAIKQTETNIKVIAVPKEAF